jgi:hypothetical protein
MNDGIMHFWYDPNRRAYVEVTAEESAKRDAIGGVTMVEYTGYVGTKKKLEDTGTRFQFLNDFLDYLGEGLIAVTNSLERYDNDIDKVRKVSLEKAIKLVQVYQDQMANRDGSKWDFNSMLDKCVPERGVLETIRKDVKTNRTSAPKTSQLPLPLNNPDINPDDLAGIS